MKNKSKLVQISALFISALFLGFIISVISYFFSISIFILLGIAYLFSITDILSTNLVLSDRNGELNPLAAYLFKKFGVIIGGLILKNTLFIIFVILIFTFSSDKFYLIIFYNNLLPSFLISISLVATINNILIWKF